MALATITSKGQITIPKEVRTTLCLKSGDIINFITEGNAVKFLPVTKDIACLKGIIKKPVKPVSIDDMNKVIKARGVKS